MKNIQKVFIFTVLIINSCTVNAQKYNYRVYMDISNHITPELLNRNDWEYVAENCDGSWMLTYDLRFNKGVWTQEKKKALGNVYKNKDTYVEIPLKSNTVLNQQFDHIKVTEDCGFRIKGVVWYREPEAVLSVEQFKKVLEIYDTIYDENLILARKWNENELSPILMLSDGIIFEFAVPYRFDWMGRNIAEGVKWCIKNNKNVYLLIPPSPDNANLDNRYINGVKKLFDDIVEFAGEDVLKSNRLAFVPAVYSWFKKKVHLTPEADGNSNPQNTGTGAAYFLLQKRAGN